MEESRMIEELETVVVERRGAAVVARINRPAQMNALWTQVYLDFQAAMRLALDTDARVLVITGAGDRAFCAGGDKKLDLGALADLAPEASLAETRLAQGLIRDIRAFPWPVVARVNGVAVGGGLDIALACDLVIAADHARFGSLWIKRGIVPALGGGWFLPRLVGTLKAKELMLTGEIIDAAEALRIGLVNAVVPAASLDDEIDAMVAQLAEAPPLAVKMTKDLVNRTAEQDLETYFDVAGVNGYALSQTAEHAAEVADLLDRTSAERAR